MRRRAHYRKGDAGRQAPSLGRPTAADRSPSGEAAAGQRKTRTPRLFAQAAERLSLNGLYGGVGVKPRCAVPAVSAARLGRSAWLDPHEFSGGQRVEVLSWLRLRVVCTLLIRHGAAPALDH